MGTSIKRAEYNPRHHRVQLITSALLVLSFVSFIAPFCVAASENEEADDWHISEVKKGVVRILYANDLANPDHMWTGSGFGVGTVGEETDIFVTNRHVVFDEDTGKVVDRVYILTDDEAVKIVYNQRGYFDHIEFNEEYMIECEILFPSDNDPEYPDYAIIRAERKVEGRVALPLLWTDEVPDGTHVWAVGYPGSGDDVFNLDPENLELRKEADVDGSKLTPGNITARGTNPRAGGTHVLTHTAQTNEGNSGGPLVTDDGQVIGINTYVMPYRQDGRSTGVVEYNLSIYIDYAMDRLTRLGIPYNVYPESKESEHKGNISLIIAAAGVVLIAIVAALLLARRGPASRKGRAYRLQCVSGYFAGKRFPIDGCVRIGRDPTNNDLVYPRDAKGISGRHCQLILENGSLYIEDTGSHFGTFYKGEKILPRQRIPLRQGDEFWLAQPSEKFLIDVSRTR